MENENLMEWVTIIAFWGLISAVVIAWIINRYGRQDKPEPQKSIDGLCNKKQRIVKLEKLKKSPACICDDRLHLLTCRRCGKVHDIVIPALTEETSGVYNQQMRCEHCGAIMPIDYGVPLGLGKE